MNDKRAANAARVRAMTVGLAVAGVVGTGAFGGLAWAQDHKDGADTVDADSTSGASTAADDSWNSDGPTTTWPQLSVGSGGSSHTRSSGS